MKIFPILALASLLSACSTPFRINIPIVRFESPELQGPENPLRADVGTQSYNRVTLTQDVESELIHSNPASVEQRYLNVEEDDNLFDLFSNFSVMYLNFAYSPSELPIEFTYRLPDRLGAKFQIYGKRSGEAKKGDASFAVTASYAKRNTTGSFGADASEPTLAEYEFSRYLVDVAAIAGVRISDKWLAYGGPFLLHSPYSMQQNLDSTSSRVGPIKGVVNTYGGNLGLTYRSSGGFHFTIESVYNKLSAYRFEKSYINGGFKLGFEF